MSEIINPNAAGIDIGSKINVVAVPEDRSDDPVRTFGTFTSDLHQLIDWLKSCRVDSVAMESTGVYWFHLYTMLVGAGIEVYLVNARHIKHVPGRKSDYVDAQWLQKLHTNGYLNASFQPDNLTRELRDIVRFRKTIVEQCATIVRRMQKAMEQMNIKLQNVISDIDGKSGRAIIKAIINGQRDPELLSKLVDKRVKTHHSKIIESLRGNWRDEQIFILKLLIEQLEHFENQLQTCDKQAEQIISQFDKKTQISIKADRKEKRQPAFNTNEYVANIYGVDVTKIPGISKSSALSIFSELGPNLQEKFPSLKQFLSWLNLVPDNEITGGKVTKRRRKKKKNRAGKAFREAANGLWNAKNPLGELLRAKKRQKGGTQAVIAVAKKIASIFYTIVTKQIDYDESQITKYQTTQMKRRIKKLEYKIKSIKSQLNHNQSLNECVI